MEVLDSIEKEKKPINWKSGIVLFVMLLMTIQTIVVYGFQFNYVSVIIGYALSIFLFYIKKDVWIYVFLILIVLILLDFIPFYYFSFKIGIGPMHINMIALFFLIIHLNVNEKSIKGLMKNKKRKVDIKNKKESNAVVSRFEFKFRKKTKAELLSILENDSMREEAKQAATNLLQE